jgi:hypothetical protein
MRPVMGPCTTVSGPILCKSLPFNSMLNVQLQIALLYRQKNERDAARECLGSHFNKA